MSDETPEVKLTNKQRAFIEEYLLDFNATRAAKAVGYSEKTAHSIGSELLTKTYIADEINARMKSRKNVPNRFEKKKSGFVYLMLEDAFGYVKIGISYNPHSRLSSLQTACPQNITLLGTLKTNDARRVETDLHERYADKHHRGEWFNLSNDDIKELLAEWKSYQRDTKNSSMNISSVSTQRTLI